MTIQASNFPTVMPALTLDLTRSQYLDPRITFARASIGTFVDSRGILQTAPVNVARFDHNPTTGESLGLLVEEQRTNLLLQSNAFTTTWSNTDAVATATQTTAPDGTTAGWKLATGTVNTNHNIFQNIAFTAVATTISVFVKYLDHRWVGIRIGSGASQFFGSWDLQNGVVGSATAGATIGMQAFGNGWYRLTLTATLTSAGNANCIIALNNADAIAPTTYTGTGTGIYLFGAQLEAGAFPTSYIPTTTAAATRSADVASIGGSAFTSFYNQSEGTVFAETRAAGATNNDGTSGGAACFSNGTTTERIRVSIAAIQTIWISGNTTQASLSSGGGFVANALFRAAAATKANDFAFTINANTVQSSLSGSAPSVSQLSIGTSNPTLGFLNGTIRRLCFWPQRLPNSTLQALTSS